MSRRFSINDVELPTSLMKGVSTQMLKELDKQDEATFYEYFEGLSIEEVKKARVKTQQLRDTNKELAVKNVELEPKFTDIKKELLERTSELHVLKEEYDKRLLELKAIQNKKNHQAVEKELAQATKKIEQESEDFAADFAGGKTSLSSEEFLEKFLKERTLYWLRKVKLEKMKELLQNYRPVPAPRTSHLPTPASNNIAPYPIASSGSMQSLPPQHQSPGYPVASNPAASLPPYAQHRPMPAPMPAPQPRNPNPFPAAAYYPQATPPRPAPYTGSRFNQHRY